jgi:hypothetical protein
MCHQKNKEKIKEKPRMLATSAKLKIPNPSGH